MVSVWRAAVWLGEALLVAVDLVVDDAQQIEVDYVSETDEVNHHVGHLVAERREFLRRGSVAFLGPLQDGDQFSGFAGERRGQVLRRVKLFPVSRMSEGSQSIPQILEGVGHSARHRLTVPGKVRLAGRRVDAASSPLDTVHGALEICRKRPRGASCNDAVRGHEDEAQLEEVIAA